MMTVFATKRHITILHASSPRSWTYRAHTVCIQVAQFDGKYAFRAWRRLMTVRGSASKRPIILKFSGQIARKNRSAHCFHSVWSPIAPRRARILGYGKARVWKMRYLRIYVLVRCAADQWSSDVRCPKHTCFSTPPPRIRICSGSYRMCVKLSLFYVVWRIPCSIRPHIRWVIRAQTDQESNHTTL